MKNIDMSRNDGCTTVNLIDYLYYQKYYKDLSKQVNASIAQQINFRQKLEEDDDATMFLAFEKQEKTILDFSIDSLIGTE